MVAPPVEDMQPVALILARLSNEEGTPDAFVHRACELLRDAMGARALSVWVKTGEQIARWSIAEGATTVSRDLISSM